MNEQDYQLFTCEAVSFQTVTIDALTNKTPRTLLVGNDGLHMQVHVYIDPQDGQIHVLKYAIAQHESRKVALVFSHTSGPDGGVKRNTDFIGSLGLYPEWCDLEFCRLLRHQNTALSFINFDAKHLERTNPVEGFAGYTATGAVLEIASLTTTSKLDFEFSDSSMRDALIENACREAGVPFVVVRNQAWVAATDAPATLEKIETYHTSMSSLATMDIDMLQDAICEEALLTYGGNYSYQSYPKSYCAYTFDMEFREGVSIYDGAKVTGRYRNKSGVSAVQGQYQGQPYFILLFKGFMDSGKIIVNLCGSRELFIQEIMRDYELIPE